MAAVPTAASTSTDSSSTSSSTSSTAVNCDNYQESDDAELVAACTTLDDYDLLKEDITEGDIEEALDELAEEQVKGPGIGEAPGGDLEEGRPPGGDPEEGGPPRDEESGARSERGGGGGDRGGGAGRD